MSVYRAVLLLSGGWLIGEFSFWLWRTHGGVDVDSFALTNPYAFFSAQALGLVPMLVILAGLWFFRRWARSLFVLLVPIAVVYTVTRPHQFASAPLLVLTGFCFILMLNGVIVAMSFLPPVRDMFGDSDLTN